MHKILIVEDNIHIADSICRHLKTWGWEAKCATDFRQVLREFAAFGPQLVLLDISLPFFNGFYWCAEIRKISTVPVIFISSASDNMNIVMAMNMGGDDFLIKPFDLNVLTAKVQAMLRRTYEMGAAADLIEHEGAVLNRSEAALYVNGRRVELSKNEYRILQVLMESRGQVVSRETLMARLWETDSYIDDNTLTVNVTRLRRKLEQAGLVNFIRTRKGTGYLIE